ncbi:Tyrosine-protein kinase receptor torso [Blattella germanica]|nr:Tyrosine-protein kinase receptor torso [Blattella germanica]
MLRDEPSTEDLRQFKQEIKVMQSVGRHPHIVSLIGCCTRSGRLRLVVEYCAEGDLLNFLRKHWNYLAASQDKPILTNKNAKLSESQPIEYAQILSRESTDDAEQISPTNLTATNKMYDVVTAAEDSAIQAKKPLTPADLLSFARQIAIGMEYLANNRVVHRDLAARNVLVCSDRTVKISDFGLSRDIYEENIYRKKGSGRLPIKWMALESLMHQVYTTQSDVWSFGILLWEIVTLGGNPYPGIPTNKLFGLLKDGYRKECPSNCKQELYDIMLACWQAKPRDRPTFTELRKMLDNLLETSSPQKYLNLNLINFKSEIKPFSRKGNQSRSSGGYLNSGTAAADTSETFIPMSPVLNESSHHYLNTPKINESEPQ